MQHVSIGQASDLLGVAVSTLRRWEAEGRLRPAFRTCGGHRRYALLDLNRLCGKALPDQRRVVALQGSPVTTKRLIFNAKATGWRSTAGRLATPTLSF